MPLLKFVHQVKVTTKLYHNYTPQIRISTIIHATNIVHSKSKAVYVVQSAPVSTNYKKKPLNKYSILTFTYT